MNWIITLALVSLGSSVTFAALDEKDFGSSLQQVYKSFHDKCNMVVGINQKDIDEMKNGTFANDERAQRYVLCLYVFSGVLSTDLSVNIDLLEYYAPGKINEQTYIDCIEETKKSGIHEPAHLMVWKATQCIYNKDPENFLMY
nr:uncharacterized protein LOC111510449 [Leptinotarsa decemlineata]